MALAERHVTALRKKTKKGFRGYPVATIAYYGPDNRHATKVAVGIAESEAGGVAHMERWFSETTDVRRDPQINQAILRFIEGHGARSVAMFDRIIGCPHEEGIDYPEGEKCPKCRFWATRDRWSGEIEH
jgi:hypothetical protein